MIAQPVSAFEKSRALGSFSLTIEPGHEEMQLAMRDLPFRHFTVADLARVSGAKPGKVEAYLTSLVAHGHVQRAGVTTQGLALFHAPRIPVQPLVFDLRGNPSKDFEIRQALWTAARRLKTFTEGELWQVVREFTQVPVSKVRGFIWRMEQAGYITLMEGKGRDGKAEWQFRHAMNTGRLPPRFCEVALAYDVNTRTFYGTALAQEVAL